VSDSRAANREPSEPLRDASELAAPRDEISDEEFDALRAAIHADGDEEER
jgi:hypothetical protein